MLLGVFLHSLSGCGGGAPHVAPVAALAPPARPQLPSPARALPTGARWLLIAEPARVFASSGLRRIVDALIPERRLTAWSERYAVDPAQVREVAVGGYSGGQLLVARGGLEARRVVEAAAIAMEVNETTADQPRPVAVGLIGPGRYLFGAADEATLVVGEGAPESWNVIFGYLDGTSASLPDAALHSAELAATAELQQAPLTLHVLAPLALPMDTPIGVVLAGQQQLAATLTSTDPARVEVWIALSGEFPASIDDNVRALVAALATEPLAAALGIRTVGDSLRVEREGGVVTIRASVATDRVVLGLQTLFGVDLWQLMDARPTP